MLRLLAPLLLLTNIGSAPAQNAGEDMSLVALFTETCTRGGVNAESILSGVQSSPAWTEVVQPTVDIGGLSKVPSREASNLYRKWDTVRQWRTTANGVEVTLVFASFPKKNFYQHLCAVSITGVRSALPYITPMGEVVRGLGLKAWNTDLPHYQEYTGRLSDRRNARAEVFSRSKLVPASDALHLSIAFQ